MLNVEDKTIHYDGLNIHVIPTKKFKTITIVAKLRAPLQRDTITKRALIPYLLNQGTKTYQTEKQLQSKLDELYGAYLSIDGAKKGDYHIISFRLDVANDKFLNESKGVISEALDLLREVIFEPHLVNNTFPTEMFNREKETLRNEIKAVVDNKMTYANMRLIDEMFKNNPYHLHVQGYEDDLNDLTEKNVYQYYKKMLQNDALDIYILGFVNENEFIEKVSEMFSRRNIKQNEKVVSSMNEPVKDVNEIIEIEPIQQAKLHIGYTTNCSFKDDDYVALHVLNGLFGGFPNSKLFANIREKNSLAYYASTRLESHKGLMIAYCGIDGKNYEQVIQIIKEQLVALKQGDFTDEEMEETKELIISQLKETFDHPQGVVEFLYQQILGEKQLSLEQFIERLRKVTKNDVVNVAQNVREHTIFLLKNESSDDNG